MGQREVNDDPIRDIRTAVIEGTGHYGVLDKVLTDMIIDKLPDFFRQPLMPAALPLVQPGELLDGQWYWLRYRDHPKLQPVASLLDHGRMFVCGASQSLGELSNQNFYGPITPPPEAP